MAVFGWDRLEDIPPQQENAFRGVGGVGGAPPGAFFRTFFDFFTKTPLSVYEEGRK